MGELDAEVGYQYQRVGSEVCLRGARGDVLIDE
jgi:hypothetical protein